MNKTWKNATDVFLLEEALQQVPLANKQFARHTVSIDHNLIFDWNVMDFTIKQCQALKHFEKIQNLFSSKDKKRFMDGADEVVFIETPDIFVHQLRLWVRKQKSPERLEYDDEEIKMEEAQALQRISFGLQRSGGNIVQAWRVTFNLTCELNSRDDHLEWKMFHILLFQVPDGREVEMIVRSTYEETY